jgi:hypothetical protein
MDRRKPPQRREHPWDCECKACTRFWGRNFCHEHGEYLPCHECQIREEARKRHEAGE